MHHATCLNCGVTLPDSVKFCMDCGQSAKTHRLNMRHIWHDIFHAFTHTDKGILQLIIQLLTRPGHLSREYIEGRRKKYFNPFSFLVIVVAVSTFLISTFNLMTFTMEPNPVGRFLNKHANVVIFLNVPFCAFFSWLFFKKSGRTYAENLVLAAYTSGERSVFYSLVIVPLMLIFKEHYFFFVYSYLGIWLLYFAWSCTQFYNRRSASGIIRGLLAALLEQILIFLLIFFAYYLYFRYFR